MFTSLFSAYFYRAYLLGLAIIAEVFHTTQGEMEDYNLEPEQVEKLKQFQEVTNLTDDEIAICTLASLDWNLERAIENHLLGDADNSVAGQENMMQDDDIQVIPPPFASGQAHVVEDFDMDAVTDMHDVLRPRVQPTVRRLPPRAAKRNGANDNYNVVDMDIAGSSSSSSHNHQNGRNGRNPISTESDDDVIVSDDDFAVGAEDLEVVSKNKQSAGVPLIPTDSENVEEALHNFVTVFEARFGSQTGNVMPSFFTGSLPDAIKEAFDTPSQKVDDRRPLAMYIHHDKSVAANIFPTMVLCKEEVSNLLRCQYVLWPWDITFKENENKLREWLNLLGMADALHAVDVLSRDRERLPLLVILTRDKGQFNVVDICSGMDASNSVLDKLMMGVDAFTEIRMRAANEQRDREERERIRQEQALEYEMSLVADKARQEAKEREEREAREIEEKQRQEEEDQMIHRAKLESELPDEPAEGQPDTVVVKFRLPEGEQCMRRFRRSEKLSVLLNFLAAKGFATENFRLFNSDFPKKDVSSWDASQTFADLKWPTREQIFVEEQ